MYFRVMLICIGGVTKPTKGRVMAKSPKKVVKSNLKQLITAKFGYLTHEEIAAKSGVSRPIVTHWMGDRTIAQINTDTVGKFAKWLNCDEKDLYEYVEVEAELMAV
jgi:transcriptional regulator with XRE-family HTH domain